MVSLKNSLLVSQMTKPAQLPPLHCGPTGHCRGLIYNQKMTKLLIFDACVANYALLWCKTFSLKIWLCKIFDKYHVWIVHCKHHHRHHHICITYIPWKNVSNIFSDINKHQIHKVHTGNCSILFVPTDFHKL